MLRQARRTDIPAMHRVRTAVLENRLTSSVVTENDYLGALEDWGRGWVIEVDDEIAGFAVGNETNGNIWALFVDPHHAGRGYGRRLHDTMVSWLWSRGLQRLWLTTDPGTRAQRFYEAAGWRLTGRSDTGELRFELCNPETRSQIFVVRKSDSIYQVTVQEGGTQTTHNVTLTDQHLARYAAGATPERLIEASFEFLLEREPKEAILPRFDLSVIERYFPEYANTIVGRL